MELWTISKLRKKYDKAVYFYSDYLTYIQYIRKNCELDESQAGIKIADRNVNNIRYVDDTTLMAGSKKELKSLLMRVKE